MSDHPLVWPSETARLYEVLWQRLRHYPQEDEALLEDAITQALELLVRQPGRYDPRRGSLLSWLWGVVWRYVHYAERQKNLRAQREVPQGFREKVWRQVVTLLGVRGNIYGRRRGCVVGSGPAAVAAFVTAHAAGFAAAGESSQFASLAGVAGSGRSADGGSGGGGASGEGALAAGALSAATAVGPPAGDGQGR
jgi:hypothetical protein